VPQRAHLATSKSGTTCNVAERSGSSDARRVMYSRALASDEKDTESGANALFVLWSTTEYASGCTVITSSNGWSCLLLALDRSDLATDAPFKKNSNSTEGKRENRRLNRL